MDLNSQNSESKSYEGNLSRSKLCDGRKEQQSQRSNKWKSNVSRNEEMESGIINDEEFQSLFPSNGTCSDDMNFYSTQVKNTECSSSNCAINKTKNGDQNGVHSFNQNYVQGYDHGFQRIDNCNQNHGDVIQSLCINEIKSLDEDELFDNTKHVDKDDLITKLRSKLQMKIKDYNLVMDILIRTKEECSRKNEQVKELQKRNNQVEKECANLKNVIERKNIESGLHNGEVVANGSGIGEGGSSYFSFYKNEYDDMKIKVATIEERYKEIIQKNEHLTIELNNLMKEKHKYESDKNNEIDIIKTENSKLKEKVEQLKTEREKLFNKYLQCEKNNFKIQKEAKEEISSLRDIITKEESLRKNSVENLNKAKEILTKSLATSEDSVKKLLDAEKERDKFKEKNENLKRNLQQVRCKMDNLKEALKYFEKMYKKVVEKNNVIFSVTHEFLNTRSCNVIILRKNSDIKHVCEKYEIASNLFEDINCFSALYTYEVIFNTPQPDSDDLEDTGDWEDELDEKDSHDPHQSNQLNQLHNPRNAHKTRNRAHRSSKKYIKIKKEKFKSLNYLLNEAQIKIIALSRSNTNFEKYCANAKNSRIKGDLNLFKRNNYIDDPIMLQNEKMHIENVLHEKLEQLKCVEKRVKEKENMIQAFKEENFRLKLEKETFLKVISSIPNLSSMIHMNKNGKNLSIESLIETTVNDIVYQHVKIGMSNQDFNEKTPSKMNTSSLVQSSDMTTDISSINVDDSKSIFKRTLPLKAIDGKEENCRQILKNLEKSIVNIENKQISYFRRSDLFHYMDDYMITLEMFHRISKYNEEFRIDHLLENGFSFILQTLNEKFQGNNEKSCVESVIDTTRIAEELCKWKKKYSEEELLHFLEESKVIQKYKQFYHNHFININNIFNTIISLNLYSMDEKEKNVYERYYNLFNLNFSNVEISFDLLLNRFEKIVKLAKMYENAITQNTKKIMDMNLNEANLYERGKKLEYDVEILCKEKENLENIIQKNEQDMKCMNTKHTMLENECKEHICKNNLLNGKYEQLKKEKSIMERELSNKQIRNLKLNEQNVEMMKLHEKEKTYLHSLIQEEKESNQFLKEKLNSFFTLNEQVKYDYDIRLNNLNALWVEEKDNNKKHIFDINNLKIENDKLSQKIKDLENKICLIKNELNERIKQITVLRKCIFRMSPCEDAKNGQTSSHPNGLSDVEIVHKHADAKGNLVNSVPSIATSNELMHYTNESIFRNEKGYNFIIQEFEHTAEQELLMKKLQDSKSDLEKEIMKLKGEKEILVGVIETWRCFSVCSKEEIKRLKNLCNEQLERHKEFLCLNQLNEDKLKRINELLGVEKCKYEKEIDKTKGKLNDEIDKLKIDIEEKVLQMKELKCDYDNMELKLKILENEKKDQLNIKQKEEEYVNLLKNDKVNLQNELKDILEKYHTEVDNNKKLMNEMEVLKNSYKEEIKKLNELLTNIKKDNRHLNEIFQKQININDNEILKNRLEQLVELNKELQEELHHNCTLREKVKCENSQLKEKLKLEKRKYLQQQKHIIELQTNLTSKNVINDKDSDFIVNLKFNLEKSRIELQNLANEFEKVHLNEEKYIMKIKILESKLSKKENENKKIEKELEQKNSNNVIFINKIKTDLDVMTEQNRILLISKEEQEKKIEHLKKENEFFLCTKNNDINIVQNEKLQQQVSEYLAIINQKEKKINELNFEIKKLMNKNNQMKAMVDDASQKEHHETTEPGESNAQNEKTTVSVEIYKYINENIDLTAELENKNEFIDKLKEEVKEKEDQIRKLNDNMSNMSHSMDKLKESVIIMEKYKMNINKHIKEKDDIIESLKNKYNNKLDDLLNGFTLGKATGNFSSLENAMSASSDEILNMLKSLSRGSSTPCVDAPGLAVPNENLNLSTCNNSRDGIGPMCINEQIVIIKCNILKLFKLGSCYLYIINRNMKEIQVLKNQVNSLEQSIESLNEFIKNLKNENKQNEIIRVNNLDEIIQLKDNIQINESSIKNLKNNLKNKEELNKHNMKNLGRYKSFIIYLIRHNIIFCDIFKIVNSRRKVEDSILNKLRNLKNSFHFYMYDSIIDELQNYSDIPTMDQSEPGNSELEKHEYNRSSGGGDWSNINYNFIEETFQNIQKFAYNFNLIVEKGQVHLLNCQGEWGTDENVHLREACFLDNHHLSHDENPNEDPRENPNEDPCENPNEDPCENPNEDPRENPNEDPCENPNEDPCENPNEDPCENPNENKSEPIAEPLEEAQCTESSFTGFDSSQNRMSYTIPLPDEKMQSSNILPSEVFPAWATSNVDANMSMKGEESGIEPVCLTFDEEGNANPNIEKNQHIMESMNSKENPTSDSLSIGEAINMVHTIGKVDDESGRCTGGEFSNADQDNLGKGSQDNLEPLHGDVMIPSNEHDGNNSSSNETLERYEENILEEEMCKGGEAQPSCTDDTCIGNENPEKNIDCDSNEQVKSNVTDFIRDIFRGIIRDANEENKSLQESCNEENGQVGNEENGQVGNEENGQVGNEENGQVGKEENGQVGKEENGQVGKEENGQVGKEENGQVGKEENGQVGKEENEQMKNCESVINPKENNFVMKSLEDSDTILAQEIAVSVSKSCKGTDDYENLANDQSCERDKDQVEDRKKKKRLSESCCSEGDASKMTCVDIKEDISLEASQEGLPSGEIEARNEFTWRGESHNMGGIPHAPASCSAYVHLSGSELDDHQDRFHQNEIHQKEIHQNEIHQNEIHQNEIHQNEIHQNEIHQSGIHQNEIHQNEIHQNEIHQNEIHQDQREAHAHDTFTNFIMKKLSEPKEHLAKPYSSNLSEHNYGSCERKEKKKKKRKYNSDSEMMNSNCYASMRNFKKLKKSPLNINSSNMHGEEIHGWDGQVWQHDDTRELENHVDVGKAEFSQEGESYEYEEDEGRKEENNVKEHSNVKKKKNIFFESDSGMNNSRVLHNYSDIYDKKVLINSNTNEYNNAEEILQSVERENHEMDSNRSCYIISSDEDCERNDNNMNGGLREEENEEEGDEEDADDEDADDEDADDEDADDEDADDEDADEEDADEEDADEEDADEEDADEEDADEEDADEEDADDEDGEDGQMDDYENGEYENGEYENEEYENEEYENEEYENEEYKNEEYENEEEVDDEYNTEGEQEQRQEEEGKENDYDEDDGHEEYSAKEMGQGDDGEYIQDDELNARGQQEEEKEEGVVSENEPMDDSNRNGEGSPNPYYGENYDYVENVKNEDDIENGENEDDVENDDELNDDLSQSTRLDKTNKTGNNLLFLNPSNMNITQDYTLHNDEPHDENVDQAEAISISSSHENNEGEDA
ncbi:hypothetical protein, conserved [Plasmodium gonderi]|uniref:Uncharacterized protein n=1 Tax=Plasmodium gonderi TaxID=77519 RepID=A0A1Y1JEH3_PLAGO|nr:hypothetical protein, conserved [Plasmodium gonderi]GAW80650.1 hypothetical protein, conserved [Plasmodium gonderi]